MAKVLVTRTVSVMPNDTSTVTYPEGFKGTAPSDHIDRIVAAGAGERFDRAPAQEEPAPPAPLADVA